MSRVCSICSHASRSAIDLAITNGLPNRRIAAQHTVTEQAVRRHAADHLPVAMTKARDEADISHAIDVVQQLKAINSASLSVLADARKSGDGELALKAIDRVLRQIQLQAQLLGELAEQPTISLTKIVIEVVDDRAS
jgi:hypothetical protein